MRLINAATRADSVENLQRILEFLEAALLGDGGAEYLTPNAKVGASFVFAALNDDLEELRESIIAG